MLTRGRSGRPKTRTRVLNLLLTAGFLLATGPGAAGAHPCPHEAAGGAAGHPHRMVAHTSDGPLPGPAVALPCAAGGEHAASRTAPDPEPGGLPCECLTHCCGVAGVAGARAAGHQAVPQDSPVPAAWPGDGKILPAAPEYALPYPNAPPR